MGVLVIGQNGKTLMPTTPRKARILLKEWDPNAESDITKKVMRPKQRMCRIRRTGMQGVHLTEY